MFVIEDHFRAYVSATIGIPRCLSVTFSAMDFKQFDVCE